MERAAVILVGRRQQVVVDTPADVPQTDVWFDLILRNSNNTGGTVLNPPSKRTTPHGTMNQKQREWTKTCFVLKRMPFVRVQRI